MSVATDPKATVDKPEPWLKTIRASGAWQGSMTTVVESRGFFFRTDEPEAVGGRDRHPTPMQYVVGAVNGCITVVIEAVAAEVGISIASIQTSSSARQDVRGFLGTADVAPHFQDFSLTVELVAVLPDGQADAFTAQVERRCPALSLLRAAGIDLDVQWLISAPGVNA